MHNNNTIDNNFFIRNGLYKISINNETEYELWYSVTTFIKFMGFKKKQRKILKKVKQEFKLTLKELKSHQHLNERTYGNLNSVYINKYGIIDILNTIPEAIPICKIDCLNKEYELDISIDEKYQDV